MEAVAVLGCQRSGTTLTGQIIGAHPDAFLIDETDGLYGCFNAWSTGAQGRRARYIKTIRSAAEKYTDFRSSYDCLEALQDKTVVLKAPNLTHRLLEVRALPVPTHFTFVARDVRAVVASMLEWRGREKMLERQTRFLSTSSIIVERFPDDLEMLQDDSLEMHVRFALIWKLKNRFLDHFREYGLAIAVFRYENLVSRTGEVSRELFSHCNLSNEARKSNHTEVMTGAGPGGAERSRPVDSLSLQTWKNVLSSQQCDEILEVTAEVMERFGYA